MASKIVSEDVRKLLRSLTENTWRFYLWVSFLLAVLACRLRRCYQRPRVHCHGHARHLADRQDQVLPAELLREALEPLFATYYAIPVLAFYPLLIILFGLGNAPKIMIAFMLGVIAVIVNTLNGLDRVPRALLKTARVVGMTPLETALRVTIPCAAPHVLTGVKFGKDMIETETVVMRSVTGTVRKIIAEHRQLEKFHLD